MLSLVFTPPREDCGDASRLLASIFFCASPTPARWLQGRLWARWSGGPSPGSVVLHGTGGRTAKRLKSLGSVVLFRNLTRDAHADACAHMRVREGLKTRTTELSSYLIDNIEVFSSVAGSGLVLSEPAICALVDACAAARADAASGRNKISGGYAVRHFAASAPVDQGLFAGTWRGNFQRRIASPAGLAASVGGRGEVGAASGRNGGNQPFFEGVSDRVGTPMLECRQETAENRASRHLLRQPAGLAASRLGRQPTPPGVRADRPGGTPPSGPRPVSRSYAQPIFRVSTDLRIRCVMPAVSDLDSRLSSKPKMGSGVRSVLRASDDRGESALDRGQQQRVGVQGGGPGLGRNRETSTLWGGLQRVN